MTGPETVERVLYNPNNGLMAIGIRVQFRDKLTHPAGPKLEEYELYFTDGRFEGYIIDNGEGVWVYVDDTVIKNSGVEDWGFL